MSAHIETVSMVAWIALGLTIMGFVMTIFFKLYNIKKTRDGIFNKAKILCKDLKRILNDVNKDNEEELYEIDLSLKSYFKDNGVKIQDLSNKLTVPQVWYFPKNPDMVNLGEMFEWLLRDFYDDTSEEEERIRVWSQNIQSFHSKYSNTFHKESKLMTFSPQ